MHLRPAQTGHRHRCRRAHPELVGWSGLGLKQRARSADRYRNGRNPMFADADSPRSKRHVRRARRVAAFCRHRPPLRGCLPLARVLADDEGISLLEVLVASVLVAIIAIGTLTGLEGAAATTNDNRLHNQAAVLASQSQETLRSEPAETLKTLAEETEIKTPHTETTTVEKQKFTIEQDVYEVNGATGSTGCAAKSKEGETTHAGGYYFKVSSVVSWPQLGNTREKVKQTSVITPPDGSALEVTVDTAGSTPEPVSGATVNASGSITTTDTSGCVIYPSIDSTTVSLTVEKAGYVTESGASKFSIAALQIAPNITTQYQVILSPAGEIKALFTYNKGKEEVKGDTFVAVNSGLTSGFDAGGTANTYAYSAHTPDSLSPFSEKWSVYAGDCTADDAKTMSSGKVADGTVQVIGGQSVSVPVPMSRVTLSVYTGSGSSSPGSLASTNYPVLITDPLCESAIPLDGTAATYEHKQETSGGHLTYPYQPFGKFALCLYDAQEKKTYTAPYENKTEEGSSISIYLGAGSKKGYYNGGTTTQEGIEITTGQTEC